MLVVGCFFLFCFFSVFVSFSYCHSYYDPNLASLMCSYKHKSASEIIIIHSSGIDPVVCSVQMVKPACLNSEQRET